MLPLQQDSGQRAAMSSGPGQIDASNQHHEQDDGGGEEVPLCWGLKYCELERKDSGEEESTQKPDHTSPSTACGKKDRED